ncbi:hypothetical protein C5S31_06775 [ANME-1 cluster archaeon GoMg2]|nr:hypothetical protein [ANME-1 cluster archaeon GoMg2]
MALKFESKEWFVIIITILLLTDIAILLNIPFLRQILGFLFLTFLPGVLILQILKLNEIGYTEKIVLSVGLSISFAMFFGLLINNLSLSLGYKTPLATIPLLISFNLAFIALATLGYKINKAPIFSSINFNLSTSEKAFLIVPILFPALSIFGMHVMNTTDNNICLILLLFLIPIYVAFICFLNQKIPKRIYPVVIFLISISLLLLLSLRSNHIIGMDTHFEYYFFRTTLNKLHWSVFRHSTLDACLSISLLPTIYQSILNLPSEFLFKILYSLLYSTAPLVVYELSKKYVEKGYAFLASCFFMFQSNFLFTEYNARTNLAILFFALAMMILFSDKVDPLKKRVLFIIFMASCMVSHYSTTYIFFFILLGAFIGTEIILKKYAVKNVVSLTIVILFFAFIFFWYSQVTERAFSAGVVFIENTFLSLNEMFIKESRVGVIQSMFGEGITIKGIPHKIEFMWTWLTFVLIGIGILTVIRRYKDMSFPELNFKKPDFLKDKFEVGYFVIALVCAGLLVAMVAVPYIATGYNLDRLYAVGITILSVFFVIGGIILSQFFPPLRKKYLRKNVLQKTLGGFNQDPLQVRACFIILLVLIPYFLCVSGVMYQVFGYHRAIILNSEGEQDYMYIPDQDIIAARWIGDYNTESQKDLKIYSDIWSRQRFALAYEVNTYPRVYGSFFNDNKTIDDGYIYLRYANVVAGKVCPVDRGTENITKYSHLFVRKSKIYANGGAELYS